MTAHPPSDTQLSRWPRSLALFGLALVAQVLLILALPFQSAYTYATGKTAVLQTAPVDPYDLLRGYFVTLSYDISNPTNLQSLPGWDEVDPSRQEMEARSLFAPKSQQLYVILEAPADLNAEPPEPWKPVRVSRDRPQTLPDNQIALQGRSQGWGILYDLEAYYIPEDQRQAINDAIGHAQSRNTGSPNFVVEVKVSPAGQAVPSSLWVAGENYRF